MHPLFMVKTAQHIFHSLGSPQEVEHAKVGQHTLRVENLNVVDFNEITPMIIIIITKILFTDVEQNRSN